MQASVVVLALFVRILTRSLSRVLLQALPSEEVVWIEKPYWVSMKPKPRWCRDDEAESDGVVCSQLT